MKTTTAQTLPWQTVYHWMRLQDFRVNKTFCKAEITTHADYPALTSMIDFINMGGGANSFNAVQADASHIHEMNYPVLAHIKRPGNEYLHIIPTAAHWNTEKETTQHWSGAAIFPERNATWQTTENDAANKNSRNQQTLSVLLVIVFIFIYAWLSLSIGNASINIFGLLSLLGAGISVLAFGAELGYQNDLVKQVCATVSVGGCGKVLRSKSAKGIAGFTPSHLSLAWFTTQFILYCFSVFEPSLFYINALASLSGIIMITWSLISQAMVIKQWCALCLGIAAVLAIQFLSSVYVLANAGGLAELVSLLNPAHAGIYLFIFLMVALISWPAKKLIVQNNKFRQQAQELKKWKTDAGLFIAQWQNEQQVDSSIWENDLIIGNRDAPFQITVACNLYCGPCAKAHKKMDHLLEKNPDLVNIRLRLLFPVEQKENMLTLAATEILKLAEIARPAEKQQMLTDWFYWMDSGKWNSKWGGSDITPEQIGKRLQQHASWIKSAAVTFTPTIFINSRRLPGRYNLEILEKILPALAEEQNMFINIPGERSCARLS